MKNFNSSIQEKVERSEKRKYTFKIELDSRTKVNNALEPLDKAYEQLVKSKVNDSFNSTRQKKYIPMEIVEPVEEDEKEIVTPPTLETKEVSPIKEEENSEGDSFFDI